MRLTIHRLKLRHNESTKALKNVIRESITNISVVSGASAIVALGSIAALSLNTRSLGISEFGSLVLIQAFISLIAGLATLESWQPFIRLSIRKPEREAILFSIGFLLDTAAAICACLVAICCILVFGESLGISEENRFLAIIYSLSLAAGISGTSKGYLRLHRHYKLIARNQLLLAFSNLAASSVLYMLSATLSAYVYTFSVIAASYNLIIFIRTLALLNASGVKLSNPLRTRNERRYIKLFLKAAAGSSIFSSSMVIRRQAAPLIIGAVIDEAAVGVYTVALRLATGFSKFINIANQVLFPEFIRLSRHAITNSSQNKIVYGTICTGLLALVLMTLGAVLSKPIVNMVGGKEFYDAIVVLKILFAGECVVVASIHLNPLIQDRYGALPMMKISLVAVVIFIPSAILWCMAIGPVGVAIAVFMVNIGVYILHLLGLYSHLYDKKNYLYS